MSQSIGIGLSSVFGSLPSVTWFVDSVAGNDGNTGLQPDDALATVATLLTKPIANGHTLAFKVGSSYKEELDLTSFTALKVQSYGSGGNNPIFDASDVITGWSKTGGRTNVYHKTITPDWSAGDDWLNVWEDDAYLIRVADLATCDALPGSCYPSLDSGTINIFIHTSDSADPDVNGKTYEVSMRQTGLTCINRYAFTITNIDTKRNLHEYGSLLLGNNCAATGCTASEGGKHNIYAGQSCALINCTADTAYAGSNDNSLFYYNIDTATGGNILFSVCTADGTTITDIPNPSATAFLGDTNVAGSFGTATFLNCTITNCAVGYNTQDTDTVNIQNCAFTGWDNNNVLTYIPNDAGQSFNITNCTDSLANGRLIQCAASCDITITNGTCTATNIFTSLIRDQSHLLDLTISGWDVTSADVSSTDIITLGHASSTLTVSTTTFTDCWQIYNTTSGATVTSDYNIFNKDAMRMRPEATLYGSISTYVAGYGQDQNSTIG